MFEDLISLLYHLANQHLYQSQHQHYFYTSDLFSVNWKKCCSEPAGEWKGGFNTPQSSFPSPLLLAGWGCCCSWLLSHGPLLGGQPSLILLVVPQLASPSQQLWGQGWCYNLLLHHLPWPLVGKPGSLDVSGLGMAGTSPPTAAAGASPARQHYSAAMAHCHHSLTSFAAGAASRKAPLQPPPAACSAAPNSNPLLCTCTDNVGSLFWRLQTPMYLFPSFRFFCKPGESPQRAQKSD